MHWPAGHATHFPAHDDDARLRDRILSEVRRWARAREAEVATQLREEQGRLTELNDRVN